MPYLQRQEVPRRPLTRDLCPVPRATSHGPRVTRHGPPEPMASHVAQPPSAGNEKEASAPAEAATNSPPRAGVPHDERRVCGVNRFGDLVCPTCGAQIITPLGCAVKAGWGRCPRCRHRFRVSSGAADVANALAPRPKGGA